jgi:hypothetical protein
MSFDVFLAPSSLTPDTTEFARRFDEALAGIGGVREHDTNVSLADGSLVEVFGVGEGSPGAMFAIRGFTPAVASAIYVTAEATRCFVISSADGSAIKTAANEGTPPEGFPDFAVVSDERELMEKLGSPFGDWAEYRDQIVAADKPKAGNFISRLFAGKQRRPD